MKPWILVLALLGSGAAVAPAVAQEPAPAAEKVAEKAPAAEKMLGDLLTLTGKTGFSLGLGGFANLGYLGAIIDESEIKVGAGLARDTFLHDAEFHFTAKQKLDQWEVGYHLDLEAAKPDDIIDEHYGYIKHQTFGELIIGAKNDAAHQLQVHGPTFAAGIKFHANAFAYLEDAHHYTDGAEPAGALDDGLYETRHSKNIINDAVKLTYKSPRLGGVQFGISYIPSDDRPGGSGGRILQEGDFEGKNRANVTHAVGYGLNYKGEVGRAKLAASVGHVVNPDSKDEVPFQEVSVGVQGSLGPVAVGGSWILREDWKDNDGVDAHVIYVSASYKFLEHYTLGLGFNHAQVSAPEDDEAKGLGQVYQSVQLGMTRKLAPGVSLGGFYQWSSQDFKSEKFYDSQHHFVGLMTGLKF